MIRTLLGGVGWCSTILQVMSQNVRQSDPCRVEAALFRGTSSV